MYHELQNLKMCPDTAICMNEILSTVLGNNSDVDIHLGYEKNFYDELSGCDNESLYIPIVPTLSEESAIPMVADEDGANHITKNPPPCDRSHVCAHDAAARTYSCAFCLSCSRQRSWEKETLCR